MSAGTPEDRTCDEVRSKKSEGGPDYRQPNTDLIDGRSDTTVLLVAVGPWQISRERLTEAEYRNETENVEDRYPEDDFPIAIHGEKPGHNNPGPEPHHLTEDRSREDDGGAYTDCA